MQGNIYLHLFDIAEDGVMSIEQYGGYVCNLFGV